VFAVSEAAVPALVDAGPDVAPAVEGAGPEVLPEAGGAACVVWALACPKIEDMMFPKMLMMTPFFLAATTMLCTLYAEALFPRFKLDALQPSMFREVSELLRAKRVTARDIA
jgi:hypothetical protein